MWYLIISTIIWLIVSFVTIIKVEDSDTCGSIIFITTVVLALVPFINMCFGIHTNNYYEETICKITGLELHNSIKQNVDGSFVLGTGYVKGSSSMELKYIFFSETQYGKKMEILPATNVYIKETNEEEPKLKRINSISYRNANWLDKLWDKNQTKIYFNKNEIGKILVVPTNTIKIEYNVEI